MKEKNIIELIVDDEITLRQLTSPDAKPYFELVDRNRSHLSQYGDETAEKYPDEESVLDSIVNPENPYKERFGIWANGTFVGTINLIPLTGGPVRLGYWLGSQFEGKRLASRSTRKLVKYALTEKRFFPVLAVVHRNNFRSIRLLKSCGFKENPERFTDDEKSCVFEIKK